MRFIIMLPLLVATLLATAPAAAAAPPPLAASASDVRPLLIGQSIPDVHVTGVDGKRLRLREVVAQQQAVLVFYRGGWCPFCNRQLAQLRQVHAALSKIGYQVITLSADPVSAFKGVDADHEGLRPDLIASDASLEASAGFGLAYRVTPTDFYGQERFDRWLAARRAEVADAPEGLPVPAVYVVGRDGRVRYQYVNVDYRVRLSAEVLLTAARVYGDPG